MSCAFLSLLVIVDYFFRGSNGAVKINTNIYWGAESAKIGCCFVSMRFSHFYFICSFSTI